MNYIKSLWLSYKKSPNPELKKEIVLNYVNLVFYVIKRTNLIPTVLLQKDDYFQFGIEGLSQAIDRFDPDYGTKFETYAIQRIRGKILDELRKYFPKKEEFDLYATTIFPTSQLSLNQDIGEGADLQLYEVIPVNVETPSDILEKKDLEQRLLDVIKKLNERERTILNLYYYEDLNYKEISQVLDITVPRVSQIHSRILGSIKLILEEQSSYCNYRIS